MNWTDDSNDFAFDSIGMTVTGENGMQGRGVRRLAGNGGFEFRT
ncbi:hypothetical protein RSSM_00481 [Rhodopirellula sallentina SM41]|uniref:Uncharacterized protein n=1 Tax=Rhodopirellula sallentina SM41 TaxID=1263870 RepID=M5UJM3_9BACT|nr:hypothetical protein RSSM_00481 [Rhodopirellula sallentina SM41]